MDTKTLLSTLNLLAVPASVRARVRGIRDNRKNTAFDSKAPILFEADDIALPVNVFDSDDSKPNIIRMLLRPDINTKFIIKFFVVRDALEDNTMPTRIDDEDKKLLANVRYISGCSGAGKSYLMREVAWRTLNRYKRVRIVYISDFTEWTECQNDNERLLYFYKAVMIGLAGDEGFKFEALDIDCDNLYTVDTLMVDIISAIETFCEEFNSKGKPLRMVFFFNNYERTSNIIDRIIEEISIRNNLFFVLLKAKNNQCPSEHTTDYISINPWFSPVEARKYIEEFRVDRSIPLSDHLYDIFSRATHYSPREMSILLSPEYASESNKSFSKSVLAFEKRPFLLNQNNDPAMRCRYVNEPVVDTIGENKLETIFRIYNNLHVDSPVVEDGNVKRYPLLNFQPYICVEKRFDCDRPENRTIEFSCPRAAEAVFAKNFGNQVQSLEVMKKYFAGDDQRKYEFAFVTTKIAIKKEGLTILKDGLRTDSQRILAEMAKMNTSICRHLTHEPRDGFNHVVCYSNANSSKCLSKTDGLDFISLVPSIADGLDTFIIAIAKESLDIDRLSGKAREFRSNPASSGATPGNNKRKPQNEQVMKAIARAIDLAIKCNAQRGIRNCNIYILVHSNYTPDRKVALRFEVGSAIISVDVQNIIEALPDSYRMNLKKVLGIS